MTSNKANIAMMILVLIGMTVQVSSYTINKAVPDLGGCPWIPSIDKFSTEKFQGMWYMGYQFQYQYRKYSPCTTFNFTATSDYNMIIKASDRTQRTLAVDVGGKSFAPNISNPAVMTWSWDFFPANSEYVTVVDTDYDNYAVLVTCSDFGIFHQKSPYVLSRTENSLPSSFLGRAKSVLDPIFYVSIYSKTQPCYLSQDFPRNETHVKTVDVDETINQIQDFIGKFI